MQLRGRSMWRALRSDKAQVHGVLPIMRELGEMEYQWRMPYDFRADKMRARCPEEVDVTPHEVAVKRTVAWFRCRPE